MKYNPDIHHRRSIRLREYDYSANGAYFVTVCTQGRECLFGEIDNNEIRLNEAGNVVKKWWHDVPDHFANVFLDEFMIMPNHFHGIIVITMNTVGAGSPRPMLSNVDNQGGETSLNQGGETPLNQGGGTPLNQGGETPPLPTLGQIVGYFKYQTTKQINQLRANPGVPVWQRNYYERVIRDERELAGIREYIMHNPTKWADDENNPNAS